MNRQASRCSPGWIDLFVHPTAATAWKLRDCLMAGPRPLTEVHHVSASRVTWLWLSCWHGRPCRRGRVRLLSRERDGDLAGAAGRWPTTPRRRGRAEGRVLGEIDRLVAVFSGYDPASEFRRWQAAPGGPAKVSPELFEVLRPATAGGTRSGGAFDPRVEVLTRLWSSAARQRPDADRRRSWPRPGPLMARPAWRLDPAVADGRAPLGLPAEPQRDRQGLHRRAGLRRRARAGPRRPRAAAQRRRRPARLRRDRRGRSASPSPRADSETSEPLARHRGPGPGGRHQRELPARVPDRRPVVLAHLRPADRAAPPSGSPSATVIAERSADADALATICNVLAPEEGLRLVESLPGRRVPDRRRPTAAITRSDGWGRYERPRPAPASPTGPTPLAAGPTADEPARPPTAAGTPGATSSSCVVNFEINQPDDGRAGATAARTWPSGSRTRTGFPVRNLTLWVSMGGAGPFQWLPDLKRWYAPTRPASRSTRTTWSSRSPGRPGRPASTRSSGTARTTTASRSPAGEYTVCIEAAREHGTYQNIRKEVTLADKPFAEELKGNVEIKSASIEYRRKGHRRSSPPARRRPRRTAGHSAAGWPSGSPRRCAGCTSTCRCSAWRPSCSSA